MPTPRKMRCQVERVIDHGDHVYTVDLKPDRPVPVFRPGQFLHLTIDEYDPSGFWPESRVFSIASSPQERDQLVISYSVKGVYTTRMERELFSGKFVWVKLPYGDFVVDGARDVVLIAGGTGITAFQAFIEGLSPDHPHKVVLLYGARRSELLLGLEVIEAKVRDCRKFGAFLFAEDRRAEHASHIEERTIRAGRISRDVLKDCVMSDACTYYLAGPPLMVSALGNELAQQGVPGSKIIVDAWE